GFRIDGEARSFSSGGSAAFAGDLDGDGYGDLVIGKVAIEASSTPPVTYVVFGQARGFGNLDLLNLASSEFRGFRITGAAPGDFAGYSVAAAGDVNDDGFADIIIGAPYSSPDGRINAGASYVIF